MAWVKKMVEGKYVWEEIDSSGWPILNVDADPDNQDWIKTLFWDLPAYKSDQFIESADDMKAFRELPLYKSAVKHGLIVDDEWKGPPEGYCRIVPRKNEKD